MTLFQPDLGEHGSLYSTIRDSGQQNNVAARDLCNQLWAQFEPLADDHFTQEFARNFHSRFWEMDLTTALMNIGLDIACPKPGPDICISNSGNRIWVEAITPTRGDGADRIPDEPEEGVYQVPGDQIALRLTAAIDSKNRVHLEYLENGICLQEEPYVIAINGCLLFGYGLDLDPPRIATVLFSIGNQYVSICRESGEVAGRGYQCNPNVAKVSGAEIPTDIFLNEAYSNISGVIFSGASVGNRPEHVGQEYVFVHNPYASNPVVEGLVPLGREYIADMVSDTEFILRRNVY